MNELESKIENAAIMAGLHIKNHAFDYSNLDWKKLDDPVTNLDREAEHIIREHLRGMGNVVGEEFGVESRGHPRTFYVDPIDGTKSFILKNFLCSVSIGVEEQGKLVGGVVYDFMKDIMYIGCNGRREIRYGGKAYEFKNDHPLSRTRLSVENSPELHKPLQDRGFHTTEKSGSIALAMAELAAGNYDGMIRKCKKPGAAWDVAAGDYLLDEKEFLKLTYDGKPWDYTKNDTGMIILRRRVADEVLEALRGTGAISFSYTSVSGS
jgi:fructose-1,6-bisphosphatase/inositol monophosphatase family enzyme